MSENHDDNLDRVWDIIEKVGVTMLTTQFSGGLRARPLEARPERDAGVIWFVTDVRSGKEHEIEAEHDVCLVFIDAGAKAYLSTPRARRCGTITPRRPRSGRALTTCGGADRTIRMSACCGCDRSLPSYGMARQAQRWPRSNSPRRGLPAQSPISARTARSP